MAHKERERHGQAHLERRHEDSQEMSHVDTDRDAKSMAINEETLEATGITWSWKKLGRIFYSLIDCGLSDCLILDFWLQKYRKIHFYGPKP